MTISNKRTNALLLVFFVYLLALAAGIVVFCMYHDSGILFATFAGDIAATLVVWIFGLIYENSSLYDPYWSIAPIVILPLWTYLKDGGISAAGAMFSIAVVIWGVRLTYNWVAGWLGLKHQDWRYTMLKEKTGKLWFLVNLSGINLMPTVIVFLGMVPAYYGIFDGSSNILIFCIGFMICLGAAAVQYFADRQMRAFKSRANSGGQCIDEGLWRFSRHPNYFGEVSFWWGIWIMMMGNSPSHWKTVIAPVLITLLFVFISIPMMEEHIEESRPDYAEYRSRVSALLPWFHKKYSGVGSSNVEVLNNKDKANC